MALLIDTFDEVVQNLLEFRNVHAFPKSKACQSLKKYNNWFFYPEARVFGPSSFIGYKNTSISRHKGTGGKDRKHGSESDRRLLAFFQEVPFDNTLYKNLISELALFICNGDERKAKVLVKNNAQRRIKRHIFIPKNHPTANVETETQETIIETNEQKYYQSLARPGQNDFRKRIIDAYNGKCTLTGCSTIHVLEAAHIMPYSSTMCDDTSNGILMRNDIHRLFDKNLIVIQPDNFSVRLHQSIQGNYKTIVTQKTITLPKAVDKIHFSKNLEERLALFEIQHTRRKSHKRN